MANDLILRVLGMNAAAALAVLLVLALRRPGRALIGAQAAYALWLIVPAVMLASLLPPRTVLVPAPAPPAIVAQTPAAIMTLPVARRASLRAPPLAPAPQAAIRPRLDLPRVLVGVWLSGIAISLVLLVLGQRRALAQFGRIVPDAQDSRMARASNPRVGPALLGTVRPKVVVPADFEVQFDATEQAMILAHERTHLAMGHAVINVLVALARAVHWFNPLVHLAARCARVDQELACDAAVMRRFPGKRQAYAQALLKTQLTFAAPPLGCGWPPRSPSRLEERIVMLAQAAPGRLRLRAGAGAVVALTASSGLAAWASQPPVTRIAPAAAPARGELAPLAPARAQVLVHESLPPEAQAAAAPQDAGPPKPIVLAQNQPSAPVPGSAPSPEAVARRRAEQESPRQLVRFDPAHFDKYVGYYEIVPNVVFKVTREGDRFYDQLTGQSRIELFPESETKFFETVVPAQLSFVIDGSGRVTALVLHQNGQEMPAPRITEDAVKAMESALTSRLKNNTPSPGTDASIRKWVLALQAGQPNYDDMTPELAAIARVQWPQTSQLMKALGPLKTLTFLRVDPQGADTYAMDFEHGRAEATIGPLTADGKVAMRSWRPMTDMVATALANRRTDNGPSPGTEAYLRESLISASKGQPVTSGMGTTLAAAAADQWPARGPIILARGALKTLTFLRVSPEGLDVYDAVYEHGEVLWSVAPLGPDGKENYSTGIPLP